MSTRLVRRRGTRWVETRKNVSFDCFTNIIYVGRGQQRNFWPLYNQKDAPLVLAGLPAKIVAHVVFLWITFQSLYILFGEENQSVEQSTLI